MLFNLVDLKKGRGVIVVGMVGIVYYLELKLFLPFHFF